MKTVWTFLLLAVASQASAAVITDATYPLTSNTTSSYTSDFDAFFANQQATQFTLSGSESVNSIRWWGEYGTSDPGTLTDDFTIRFFLEDGSSGNPLTTPFQEYTGISTSRSDSGFLQTALTPDAVIFEHVFNLPATLNLTAGDYWISIVNDIPTNTDNWYWAATDNIAPRWNRNGNSGTANSWNSGLTGQLAYELNDAAITPVPEPSVLALTGIPLMLGAYRRRSRKKAKETLAA